MMQQRDLSDINCIMLISRGDALRLYADSGNHPLKKPYFYFLTLVTSNNPSIINLITLLARFEIRFGFYALFSFVTKVDWKEIRFNKLQSNR